jgi:hypothetical protein
MPTVNDQQIAANYMGAVAHLLGGRPGRDQEFIQKVELILSGSEPHTMQLMMFAKTVQRTGRPVVWICHSAEAPHVPSIGLVAMAGDQAFTIENCMLWMSATSDRACLIPDNFKFGAFKFDDELRLRHMRKAPAQNHKSSAASMSRAYIRLREIEAAQRERGEVFSLPELAKAA